jgi:hypothetical protein
MEEHPLVGNEKHRIEKITIAFHSSLVKAN